MYIFNDKGEVKQYWNELVLTKVTGTAFSGDWDLNLLAPYVEYQLFTLTGDKSLRFSKSQCEELVNKASSKDVVSIFELNGYSIILKKDTLSTNEEPVLQEALYYNSQLHIAGLDQTFILEIAQLSVADK